MGLLLIAVVYGFLWWASGRKSSVEEENMEKAGTETCFFVKSACNEEKILNFAMLNSEEPARVPHFFLKTIGIKEND